MLYNMYEVIIIFPIEYAIRSQKYTFLTFVIAYFKYDFVQLFVFIMKFHQTFHFTWIWESAWFIYLKYILWINWKEYCWQLCWNIRFYKIFTFQCVDSFIAVDIHYELLWILMHLSIYSVYIWVTGMSIGDTYVKLFHY